MIEYSLSYEEYAKRPGLRAHELPKILENPMSLFIKDVKKESPAMIFGTHVHTAVLEPDSLDEFSIPLKMLDDLRGIRDACFKHGILSSMLKTCKKEVSVFVKDHKEDFIKKIRVDAVDFETGFVVDLKTAASVSKDVFKSAAEKYYYHTQMAYYIHNLKELFPDIRWTPLIAAVEKVRPYNIKIFELRGNLLSEGFKLMDDALDIYRRCLSTGVWNLPEEIVGLD